jgi:molecular chaperone GrpE
MANRFSGRKKKKEESLKQEEEKIRMEKEKQETTVELESNGSDPEIRKKTKAKAEKGAVSDNEGQITFTEEEILHMREELSRMIEEREMYKDQLIRAQADYSNLKKRKDREVAEGIRFAKEDLVKTLLPMLDDFDRTLQAIEKTDKLSAIKEGITLVSNNIRSIFGRIGIQPIEAVGQAFDSELHEAITSIPVEEEEKKGRVMDEVEKGYRLHDRVVRFSKVVVGE